MILPPWSFSHLNTWLTCPHQYAHKYVLRDLPSEPQSEAMKWGNTVHEAFEARLSGWETYDREMFKPYERYAKALDNVQKHVEVKLGIKADGFPCDFFDPQVWGRGKLDVVVVNTHHPVAVVIDWKTGRVWEDPFELAVHGLLLKAHWPHVKSIQARYCWLKEGRLGEPYDVSDTQTTRDKIKVMVGAMEQQLAAKEWPKRRNPLCRWCPVVSCEYNERGKK